MNSKNPHKHNEIDPTFGTNGRLEIRAPGALHTYIDELTQNIVGAIFISGSYKIHPFDENNYYTAAVGKLTANGPLELTFGTRGLALFPEDEDQSGFISLGLQSNEDFFVSGRRLTPTGMSHVTLAHYNPAGQYINTVTIEPPSRFNNSTPQLLIIKSANEQLNDKVLLALTTDAGGAILRRKANGQPDNSFGNNGEVLYLPGDRFKGPFATHIAQGFGSSSERFYVAGTYDLQPYFARLNMAGELDPEFAEGGILFYTFFADTFETYCQKILPLANGGLLALIRVAGSASYVIKLTASGVRDTTFHGGKPMPTPGKMATDMALQVDGKFIVSHYEPTIEEGRYVVINGVTRYSSTGKLDTNFGNEGVVVFRFKTDFHSIRHVIVQPDGKIVVSGSAKNDDSDLTVLIRLMA